ncbi:hypothetical protein VARIO8X_70074 [Burkholderiales bacterium 8X]|nr:hypothetical protein VARIO8X_70074 [Burkholderiales bacterium 8X]
MSPIDPSQPHRRANTQGIENMKSYAINPGRLWAFEIKQDELKDHRFLIEHAEGRHTFINYDVQSEILSIAVCAPEFDPRFAEALLIECGNFYREVEQGDHIIVLHTSVGGAELAKAGQESGQDLRRLRQALRRRLRPVPGQQGKAG